MQIEDKYVAVKLPKDLHTFVKKKAKETNMTLGNYLFSCICKVHNIKYVPASVELPKEISSEEEIKKDIEELDKEEEQSEQPTVEQPTVEQPTVEQPTVEQQQGG